MVVALAVCSALAGMLALLVALLAGNVGFGASALALLVVPALVAATARRRADAQIAIEPEGLRVIWSGRSITIRSEDIEDAYAADRTVRIQLANGSLIVAGVSEDPNALLDEAGLTWDKRTLVAPLRGTLGAFTRGFVAFFVALLAALPIGALLGMRADPLGLAAMGFATSFTVAFTKRFGWPRVAIGTDGIRILGGLRQRYFSYAQILQAREHVRVAADGPEIAVQLRSGETLFLPTIAQPADQRAALVDRINAGVAAYTARESKALVALDRSGRAWHEWRDALRRLAQGEGSFREQAIGREDLERVLADPRSSVERRVAAALALREMGPDAHERVRIAAAATVDERVRVALDAAAEDELDEEKLERLLRARS